MMMNFKMVEKEHICKECARKKCLKEHQKNISIYCNQCGFVAYDDEDFQEHIEETGHTGYKGDILIR